MGCFFGNWLKEDNEENNNNEIVNKENNLPKTCVKIYEENKNQKLKDDIKENVQQNEIIDHNEMIEQINTHIFIRLPFHFLWSFTC